MVAGVVIGVVAVVFFVLTIVKTVLAPAHDIPGQFQVELAKGRWTIYQHTGRELSGATDSSPAQRAPIEFPRLTNESVRITGPNGQGIIPRQNSANETITQGTSVFTAAMVFDVETAGRHDFQVTASLGGKTIVSRGFGDTFVRAARWIALMFAAGLLFLLGGIMLIVGIVRRRNTAPPGVPPPPPPPAPPYVAPPAAPPPQQSDPPPVASPG